MLLHSVQSDAWETIVQKLDCRSLAALLRCTKQLTLLLVEMVQPILDEEHKRREKARKKAAAAAQDAARTELAQIDALVLTLDARRQVLRRLLIGSTAAAPTATASGMSGNVATAASMPPMATVAPTVAAGPTAAQAAAASIAARQATVPGAWV